ncbi:hypothetical protein [Curtobacterium sp. USHLN213]|uniref:hypothetical protein n=1 Tax=Curtobacterium sp. USHLN213 TaxID=3081255 RepID=UPI0030167600
MTQNEQRLRRRQTAIRAELERRAADDELDVDQSQAERLRRTSERPRAVNDSDQTQAAAIRARLRRR